VFGMELNVVDNPKSIQAGYDRLAQEVEEQITPRVLEQAKLLRELGKANH